MAQEKPQIILKKIGNNKLGVYFLFIGIILGGYLSSHYLMATETIAINPEIVSELSELGFANAGQSYLPSEIFSTENIFSLKGFAILIGAGFLIGFGARYAGGWYFWACNHRFK